MSDDYDSLFEDAGRRYNVDPRLLKTVFHLESSGGVNNGPSLQGDPDSPIGPMQMRPSTAVKYKADPRDIKQAIPAAAQYLAEGLNATGNAEGALSYYHGGPDQSQWGTKTSAYVTKGQRLYPTMAMAQTKAADPDEAAGMAAFDTLTQGDLHSTLTRLRARTGDIYSAPKDAAGAPAPSAQPFSVGEPKAAPSDPDEAAGMAAFDAIVSKAAPDKPAAPRDPVMDIMRPAPGNKEPAAIQQAGSALANGARTMLGGVVSPDTAASVAADVESRPPLMSDIGPRPAGQSQIVYEGNRLLAPAPNTTYGSVLPFAKDNTTGDIRVALPDSIRSLGQGVMGLLDAPRTGTIPPESTMALAALPGGMAPSVARGTGAAIAENRLLSPEFRAAPMTETAAAKAATPAVEAPPTPSTPPVPQSVGAAATPSNLSPMERSEAMASRATGEQYRLNQQAKQGHDDTEYVPGVKPTAAEVTGDPATAAVQMKNESQNPAPFKDVWRQNNERRIDYFEEHAGTPTIVNTAEQARDAQATKDLAAAWGSKSDVDATPVVSLIDQTLAGPAGKLDPVRATLEKARNALFNKDGKVETDPEMLYGARKQVAFLLSKNAQAENPSYAAATRELMAVKDALDTAIESGAPGYKDYLSNYASASRPIEAMQLLQEWRPRIVDKDGFITLAKYNQMMKDVVKRRQMNPEFGPAASIDDATMEALWNIRSDLQRAENVRLGKLKGESVTDQMKDVGRGALYTALAAKAPVVGPVGLGMFDRVMTGRLTNKLLDGSKYGRPSAEP